jgi:transposase
LSTTTPEGFALFAAWLAGFGPEAAHLCMEATGAYSLPLADFLSARGFSRQSSTPPRSPPSATAN